MCYSDETKEALARFETLRNRDVYLYLKNTVAEQVQPYFKVPVRFIAIDEGEFWTDDNTRVKTYMRGVTFYDAEKNILDFENPDFWPEHFDEDGQNTSNPDDTIPDYHDISDMFAEQLSIRDVEEMGLLRVYVDLHAITDNGEYQPIVDVA